MPGRLVRRSTYLAEYKQLPTKTAFRSSPALWKDLVFSGAIIAAVAVCAFVFGPYGPSGQPDPSIIQTVPKPDFSFLWIYTVLAYLPPEMETPFILIAPLLAIAGLIALPFYASEGEKLHRRPVAVLTVSTIAVCWGVLTHLGTTTPWSPHMNAWSSDPIPVRDVQTATPLVRQGASFSRPAVPQLPLDRRRGRRARPCARRCGHTHDHRPDAFQGRHRWRQHACIRQESFSGGDPGAG